MDVLRRRTMPGASTPASVERGVVERGRAPVDETSCRRPYRHLDGESEVPTGRNSSASRRKNLHAGHHEHAPSDPRSNRCAHEPVGSGPTVSTSAACGGAPFQSRASSPCLDLVPELRRRRACGYASHVAGASGTVQRVPDHRSLDPSPASAPHRAARPATGRPRAARGGRRSTIVPVPERLSGHVRCCSRNDGRPTAHVVGHLRPREPEHVPTR
jgi:hypothetical protein